MSKNSCKTSVLFFLLLICIMVQAQQLPANLRFNKFTTENGLSDNHAGTIIKDKKGYFWISVIGTTIKSGQNVLNALSLIAKLGAE